MNGWGLMMSSTSSRVYEFWARHSGSLSRGEGRCARRERMQGFAPTRPFTHASRKSALRTE